METRLCASRDLTVQEWDELRELYVKAFVAMSATVSAHDLALLGNNPEHFWERVFDRDKPNSIAKNYTFKLTKENERIVAYGLYTYLKDAQYLYIHHFVVHPDYQGKGLGKSLMSAMQESHLDAEKIGLWTRTYNVQAQNFYKRLGFSVSLHVPDAIREYDSSDRVYMERNLG